jgi:hypothetical protein
MDDSLDKNTDLKDRINNFFKKNKLKIYFLILTLIIILISMFLINKNQIKNNYLISEKYIKAGLYLSSKNNEEAKKTFEEIIFSENKFYAILALNTILEKNLEKDRGKILEYFYILENIDYSKEKKDLIVLKKALYLSRISETQLSNKLLQNLVDKNSILKNIAKDLIIN